MKAVIMAGGEGSRLRPVTTATPKPLIEFGGTPLLHHVLRRLRAAGFTQVTLALRHQADLIRRTCENTDWGRLDLRFVVERQRMGTAGALSLIPASPTPALVMNADLLTSLDFARLMRHHDRSGADATVVVTPRDTEIEHGVVEIDEQHRVLGLTERPRLTHLVNCGMYVLDPVILDHLPRGEPYDMPALLETARAAGRSVLAHLFEGEWRDIGTPRRLEEARLAFEADAALFAPRMQTADS
ncbi:NDP-sugar synthase [Streptomyces sp. NPDC091377]|uniref:nucleotidyltransferase family protein n=1 Tax=Streptomyces sp. NPDC091377 TaxID=3365995 RepID=UPI00381EB7FA